MSKRIMAAIVVAILVVSLSSVALANEHALARMTGSDLKGAYFYATIQNMSVQDPLYDFILHTTWLINIPSLEWIELGFVDGMMLIEGERVIHRGFYAATQINDVYKEYILTGPSTAVGTSHAFQIQKDGTNTWGLYLDYTFKKSITWSKSPDGMDVGLETNWASTKSSEWNERNFQYYKTPWTNWTSGTLVRSVPEVNVRWATQPTAIYTSK